MRNKAVILVSVICVLACLMAVIPAETEAANANFRVGYSRVDINPYIDPTLTGSALVAQSNIMALPLYGSGDVWNRLSTYGLVDDNGDGELTSEDGLKATCIAVTDYKGNTVLLITVDMIGALQANRVRSAIMDRVNAAIAGGEVQDVVMDISQIYYTGTHTHNAPQADAYSAKGRTDFNNDGVDLNVVNTNLSIWIDRTVANIAEAAVQALKDRAEATVIKDAIAATACTDPAVQGKTMNSVRHYVASDKGCVAGDNFNDRGSNPKQVTQVNNAMYVLKFSFADTEKLPIVVVNWRGHPSLNNTTSASFKDCSKNGISSDFVNAFRRTLETNATISAEGLVQSSGETSCRVAFFQAAGGNVNPRGYEKTNGVAAYSWIDTYAKKHQTSRGNIYGRVLGAMAQNCLSTSAGRQTVAPGEIRTMRHYKNGTRNATGVSALAYEAATYYQEMVGTGTYVYTSPHTGEKYVIGSKFHANSLLSKWQVATQTPLTGNIAMEINAILIGEDLAFVTGSGELFDYYYKENGVYTKENNAWNDLINTSTYGTPFVLELCNAMNGYVPNYEAYDYNLNSEQWARGSYEAHTTPYPQGTGEAMIQIMKRMLDTLAVSTDGAREAYCRHCEVNAIWLPYDGKTEMTSQGHYYLPEDNHTAQIHVKDGKTLCFDLNGHTLTGDSRAFYTASGGNATLSIMDTSEAQTGVIRGGPGITGAAAGYGGGVIVVDKTNTLNIYGGTLEFKKDDTSTVCSGGILHINGTVNMYGGRICGGYSDSFTGKYINGSTVVEVTRTGQGAAISVKGTFRMYGGVVESGELRQITGSVDKDVLGNDICTQKIESREGIGECIYAAENSVITLFGDATVQNLYLAGGLASKLTVAGTYTGSLELSYPEETTLELHQRIATAEDADVSGAQITFRNVENLTAAVKGDEVIVSESSHSYRYCNYCNEILQWIPVTDAQLDLATNTKGMTPGHYILMENTVTTQKQLNPDGKNPGTFCFDLNGYEFHGDTRAFYVYNNATLNLQDSRGGGFVQGDKGTNNYGGSLYCSGTNGVINIYGITVKATPVTNLRGGVLIVASGTVNLYDAQLLGGHSKDYGGTVFCSGNSKLNIHAGTVASGTTDGKGNGVYLDTFAKLTLSADAVVEDIYVGGDPSTAVTVDTTAQAFTGTAVMQFKAKVADAGIDVGNVTGQLGMQDANLTTVNGMDILQDDTDLKTARMSISICADGQPTQYYSTLEKAIKAYTGADRSYIRLETDQQAPVKIEKDICLDLNGCEMSGSITVSQGATLYCMDTATDDYTIFDDEGYGHLSGVITGNVLAVQADTVSPQETSGDTYRAGYVAVTRKEGLSFHRVNLQIRSVALRPGSVGMYFQCPFKADEVAAEEIYGFGIALSVYTVPNADNLETDCEYTSFDVFDGGPDGNPDHSSGTLLRNIMRTTNTDAVNAGNAQVPIYGCAYVLTQSGYAFGRPVACSFRDLVLGVDGIWETLDTVQQQGVLDLYRTYERIMAQWEIPNIKEALQ